MQLVFPKNTAVSGKEITKIDGTRIIHNEHCFTFTLPNGSTWEDTVEFMEARTPDGTLQAVIKK
jgi:hypothetical protein